MAPCGSTEADAAKVDEVQQAHQVNVSYSDPKNNRSVSRSVRQGEREPRPCQNP